MTWIRRRGHGAISFCSAAVCGRVSASSKTLVATGGEGEGGERHRRVGCSQPYPQPNGPSGFKPLKIVLVAALSRLPNTCSALH